MCYVIKAIGIFKTASITRKNSQSVSELPTALHKCKKMQTRIMYLAPTDVDGNSGVMWRDHLTVSLIQFYMKLAGPRDFIHFISIAPWKCPN